MFDRFEYIFFIFIFPSELIFYILPGYKLFEICFLNNNQRNGEKLPTNTF